MLETELPAAISSRCVKRWALRGFLYAKFLSRSLFLSLRRQSMYISCLLFPRQRWIANFVTWLWTAVSSVSGRHIDFNLGLGFYNSLSLQV